MTQILKRFRSRALAVTCTIAGISSLGAIGVGAVSWGVANGDGVDGVPYPFAASLSMPTIPTADGKTRASGCTGALVAPEWIATAGHCFHDSAGDPVSGPVPYQTTVTLGREKLSGTGGVVIEVKSVVQADGVDFALARLEKPAEGIEPLAISRSAPKPGDVLRMTGWGTTDGTEDITHRSDQLQTGQWKVTSVDDKQVFALGFAPEPTTSACPFDSGAPYFAESPKERPRLVSTEITGPTCPHSQAETTARLDVLADWIDQQTNMDAASGSSR